MRKSKGIYRVQRHPNPTPLKRWACVDSRDGTVVSEHKRKSNAQAVAGLSNSIAAKYGSIHEMPTMELIARLNPNGHAHESDNCSCRGTR